MLNALEPGTYTRPHKHRTPDKTEVFIILKGRILAVEFDEKGTVIDRVILDIHGESRGVEFPPRSIHSLICLEEDSVVYELKDGPYDPKSDKVFMSWAPHEGSGEALEFNKKILKKLGIRGTYAGRQN